MSFRWGERLGRMILSIRRNFPGVLFHEIRVSSGPFARSFVRRQPRLTALIYWPDSVRARARSLRHYTH